VINFLKKVNKTRFHNPMKNFELDEVASEKRYDPLTGKMVRIFPFRQIGFPRHDWIPFVEESKKRFCPFCPEVIEKTTPRFPEDLVPEGKVRVGESFRGGGYDTQALSVHGGYFTLCHVRQH